MNFPWACSSTGNNYSDVIFKCYSSATNYISVEDEKNLRRGRKIYFLTKPTIKKLKKTLKTQDALKIVLESKIKKDKLFKDKAFKSQSDDPNNHTSIMNQDAQVQKKIFKKILRAIESEDQLKKSSYYNEESLGHLEKKPVYLKLFNLLKKFT
jgi:hypothetical protein